LNHRLPAFDFGRVSPEGEDFKTAAGEGMSQKLTSADDAALQSIASDSDNKFVDRHDLSPPEPTLLSGFRCDFQVSVFRHSNPPVNFNTTETNTETIMRKSPNSPPYASSKEQTMANGEERIAIGEY
jgi:hypothetical protein